MHTIKRFSHGKESKSFHVCFQISLPILFGMGTFLSKESPSTLVTGKRLCYVYYIDLDIPTLSLHVLIKYVGHTHIFMVSQESKLMG